MQTMLIDLTLIYFVAHFIALLSAKLAFPNTATTSNHAVTDRVAPDWCIRCALAVGTVRVVINQKECNHHSFASSSIYVSSLNAYRTSLLARVGHVVESGNKVEMGETDDTTSLSLEITV